MQKGGRLGLDRGIHLDSNPGCGPVVAVHFICEQGLVDLTLVPWVRDQCPDAASCLVSCWGIHEKIEVKHLALSNVVILSRGCALGSPGEL